MQKITVLLISACVALFAFIGCAANQGYAPAPSNHILTGDLVSSGYTIADTLLTQSKYEMDKNSSNILVASFVNINNLTESSTLGRLLAEQVSSRLSQRGYKVIDMRMRDSVFMEEGKGEFLLSRDLKEVAKNHKATAAVVGTYGESLNGIYVSTRIVNPSDNSIISSCDYGLQMGRASDILMRNK